jgi:hypothetical protein
MNRKNTPQSKPLIESLEGRELFSVSPLTAGTPTTSPDTQTQAVTARQFSIGTVQQPQVVISIIAVLIAL